jgi:hypothetical protein
MGTADITVLHALGTGEPELPLPLLEAESFSLGNFLRMVCSNDDALRAMALTIVPESPPSGDGLSSQSGQR